MECIWNLKSCLLWRYPIRMADHMVSHPNSFLNSTLTYLSLHYPRSFIMTRSDKLISDFSSVVRPRKPVNKVIIIFSSKLVINGEWKALPASFARVHPSEMNRISPNRATADKKDSLTLLDEGILQTEKENRRETILANNRDEAD